MEGKEAECQPRFPNGNLQYHYVELYIKYIMVNRQENAIDILDNVVEILTM